MPAAERSAPGSRLAALETRTLFLLWTTYASFYVCRVNIGQAVEAMRADLGFTALEMGLVLGAVKLGYAGGQFVNGQLTERFGARRILGIGMAGSSAATALFAVAPALSGSPLGGWLAAPARAAARLLGVDAAVGGTLAIMILLAFGNGWFQAGGWPPCVKVAANWFPVARRGRTMGILGTSYTVGSAIAILAVGALVKASGNTWRVAFVVPAAFLALSAIHTSRLRERPPDSAPDEAKLSPTAIPARLSIGEALGATLTNPRIWILALGLFGLDAVRYGFIDWAPSQLAEMQGGGVFAAALKTAVLPLAGAVGTLSSNWLTDRFFDSRRAPVCALMLGALAALTLGYRAAVAVGAGPTVIVLALSGYCLFGAHILLVGTAAQDFARRGATAAAAGFVDFTGHAGAFCGDVVTGWMVRRYGWAGAVSWWSTAAIVSAALVATLWRARPVDARHSSS